MPGFQKTLLFLVLCLFFGFLICAACTQKADTGPLVTAEEPRGIPDGGTCPEPLEWCNDRCADLIAERENCGACGNICPDGRPCVGGKCESGDMPMGDIAQSVCDPGLFLCEGGCMDLENNPDHCGSCGNVCPPGQPCIGGACSSGVPVTPGTPVTPVPSGTSPGTSCLSGQTNCNGSCADLQSDTGHCGTCNTACTAGQVCSGGSCVLSWTGTWIDNLYAGRKWTLVESSGYMNGTITHSTIAYAVSGISYGSPPTFSGKYLGVSGSTDTGTIEITMSSDGTQFSGKQKSDSSSAVIYIQGSRT